MKRVRAMMARWRHRIVMAAFSEWGGAVAYDLAERQLAAFRDDLKRATELIDHSVISSATQKMKVRGARLMTKAINSWRGFALRRTAIRHIMQRVVKRIQLLVLSCSFGTWQSATRRRVALCNIMGKAARRIASLAVSKSFDAMLSEARKMKRVRSMMLRWRYHRLADVLSQWADVVAYEVSKRTLASQQERMRTDVSHNFEETVHAHTSEIVNKLGRFQGGVRQQLQATAASLPEGVPPVTPTRVTQVAAVPNVSSVSPGAVQLLEQLKLAEQKLGQHTGGSEVTYDF
jgi:hypothetical protein